MGWIMGAVAVILAAGLRLWQIDSLPPGFHFDEAFEGMEAWRILLEPSYRPVWLTGNFGVPPLNAYLNALGFGLARAAGGEAGPTAMRVVAALLGVLGVAAVMGLADEMRRWLPDQLSPALPWLSGLMLAGMRWHLHFSRMGIEPVMVPLIWAAALWALLRGWRTGAWQAFALSGALMALGMYAYQGAWVIPFLLAATALHLLWQGWQEQAQRTRRLVGLGMAGTVALAGVLPLALFFVQHPDSILMRPTQLAIVGETSSPADGTVGSALWATVKMFGPFGLPGDPDPRRNMPGLPALNVWQALPFYLGLALAVWRVRRPVYAALAMGLVGLLLPGVLSEYAPHFHRILGAAGPAALLGGLGLDAIWQGTRWIASPRGARVGPVMALALLAGGTVQAAHTYFVRWAHLPDLYYAFDVGLWETGQWVAAQAADQPDQPFYISPRGAEHPTLAFAWRERPGAGARVPRPVTFDGRTIFPLTAGINPVPEQYVVIEHEDWRTPLLLPEVLPAATSTPISVDLDGAVYARVYTRPAQSEAARPPRYALGEASNGLALGDGIALLGVDVLPEPPRAGASLYVQAHWRVTAAPEQDWTVFVHVVAADGTVVAGYDRPPGNGALPTPRWQPGWRVLDEVEVPLPSDLPPGDYGLRLGLYTRDGQQLPGDGAGVTLGAVTIAAPE